jgi:hypothetical protein
MEAYQIEMKAREMNISPKIAFEMRVKYLFGQLDLWDDYLDLKTSEMPESTYLGIMAEICKIRIYAQNAKLGKKKVGITDANIDSAREYPVEKLIEFNRGTALAFCHADKKPSLTWDKKRNRAHCFVCDKDFSAIDILMERDGVDFITAVKHLSA